MRSQSRFSHWWEWSIVYMLVIGLTIPVFLPDNSVVALEQEMDQSDVNISFIGDNAGDHSGYEVTCMRDNLAVLALEQDTDLSLANASFIGEEASDISGWSVAGAGDVNGDGIDDILIGAPYDDEGGNAAGQTYLLLGRGDVTAWNGSDPLDLVYANASFIGEDASDISGYSVAGAGDVNGDGYDDILIGAHGDDDGGNAAGQTYLILGRGDVTAWNGSDPLDLAYANASFIGEDASDYSGRSVAGAGDVNNDGYADILIGAPRDEEGGNAAGQTYLILGRSDVTAWNGSDPLDLSFANASFIGEDAGDNSGRSVAGADDVNGDGYADILIGAYGSDNDAGQTYLLLGRADVTAWNGSDPLDLEYANASFIGEDASDCSGWSVAGTGDVNGDGYADILIGAYEDDEGGSYAGQTYLILGRADVTAWNGSDPLDLEYANASFIGEDASDCSGWSVAGAGDVNNDGYNDILIGAVMEEKEEGNGTTYLLLGRADVTAWNGSDPLDLAYANASFIGEEEFDESGYSVAGAGDVNGDGIDDILIGTPYNDEGGSEAGKTYLILGVDTTAPTWTMTPTDQVIEFGDNFQYDLEAFDFSGIDHWWINDTTSFSIDADGTVTNVTTLAVAIYWVEVQAYDSYNNYCTTTFKITVQDTTTPTWTTTPTNQVIEFGAGLSYDLNASDLSGIDHWWINDTNSFSIDITGRITNATTLGVGVYWVEVRAYDPYNYCPTTFKITVQDTTSPTWTTTPANQVIEFGAGLSYDLEASDLSGIDHWWINDTNSFSIDITGRITNATTLGVGVYWVEVRAYDPYNYCPTTFKITVQDTTSPTWTTTPANQVIEFGAGLSYDLEASDLSGIDHWWINDTTFSVSADGTIGNATSLAVGEYWLEVRAYDPHDNYCTTTFKITVQAGTATSEESKDGPGFTTVVFLGSLLAFVAMRQWKRRNQ